MTGAGDLMRRWPPLRRLVWRAGRRLYCAARGEPRRNSIAVNGEAYVQQCVVAALAPGETLTAFDIGAYHGEWSLSLLDLLRAAGRGDARLRAFEPATGSRAQLRAALAAHPLGALVAVDAVALSDAAGRARFALMSENGGSNSLSAPDGEPPCGWLKVETCDLTSFCRREGIERIHSSNATRRGMIH